MRAVRAILVTMGTGVGVQMAVLVPAHHSGLTYSLPYLREHWNLQLSEDYLGLKESTSTKTPGASISWCWGVKTQPSFLMTTKGPPIPGTLCGAGWSICWVFITVLLQSHCIDPRTRGSFLHSSYHLRIHSTGNNLTWVFTFFFYSWTVRNSLEKERRLDLLG